ncbi:MAG: hypothetical protein R2940_09130 [Syntrophotaleaceae bacterium]
MSMRLLLCILLLIVLSGCAATWPAVIPSRPPDEQLFLQGMEEWRLGEETPDAFKTLQNTYPDSIWTEKIQSINNLSTLSAQQKSALDRLNREITSCRQENKLLQQQKNSLENDQKKLKKLLIDLERR